MKKHSKPKEQTPLLSHPLFLVSVTVVFFLIFISLQNSKQQATISKQSIQNLENTVAKLETEVKQKEGVVAQGQSALELEKIQRNQLLQQKEGEIILQIPEKKESGIDQSQATQTNGPWEEWKALLWGKGF